MKYVITGGSSFIGVALTKLLIKEEHEVIVVSRRISKSNDNIPQNVHVTAVLYEDLFDIKSILNSITAADVFIHLAWSGTSHEGRHDAKLQNDNIKYSLEAVDVAQKLGCRLFLDAGSQAEYGYVKDIITEETECHPDNEYGRAKLKFGELASKKCQLAKIKFIHLRIMSIYGVTDHLWTLVMSSIKKMLDNEPLNLSSCEQLWNFVCIEDAVRQIYLLCCYALRTPSFQSEIYHIGSNDTRKLRSFVDEMYHLTKSKSKLEFGKYVPANVVSLNPSMNKTEQATGGFISDYTFHDVIIKIIDNFKHDRDDKSK